MSSIVVAGDTSGSVTLSAPAVAGGTVLTLPTTSATLITDSSGILNIGSGQLYKDASGNVGIGTTLPGYKLHVRNDSASASNWIVSQNGTATGSVGSGFIGLIGTAGTNYFTLYQNVNGDTVLSNSTSTGVIAFGTNAGERMRIDSGGNFLLGTTSNGASNSGSTIMFPSATFIQHISGTASGSAYMGYNYNGAGIGSITQNGTTGVLYNLTSDYRLKNNPTVLTGASEFIKALQPKTWDWWDGSGKGVGFIAHEFMEVAKYSGNGTKDEVDAEGKPVMQAIQPSSSEVMANLVSFVQEQQTLIEALTARLTKAGL